MTSTRKTAPKWKALLTKEIGEDKVKEILDGASSTTVVSLKVDINKQAVVGKEDLT